MDKNKAEQLKEILNKTLSTEDIEKKLKEETKVLAKKKEEDKKREIEEAKRLKEEEDKKIKEESPINEEIIVPSVRDKQKDEEKESNLILYIVSIIAFLLLALAIYVYTTDNPFSKTSTNEIQKQQDEDDLKSEPLIKEIVKEEVSKAILEKSEEENKTEYDKAEEKKPLLDISKNKKIVENTQVEKKDLVEKELPNKTTIKEEPKAKEIIKEIIKEKVITKVVPLDKQSFKKFYNSTNYNTLKCYNFKAGDIFPDKDCKTKLKTFLKKNKDSLRFEIIPVVAEDDNKIFTKMKSNLKGLEQEFQEKVKEYMYRGLSRERVLETSWQIKDTLGEDTVLTPTNYYVKSKKNNKGVIIKAYH